MTTILAVLSGVTVVATEAAAHHVTEVPELASMALLSVVLAGVSVAVRRGGPKAGNGAARKRRDTDPS